MKFIISILALVAFILPFSTQVQSQTIDQMNKDQTAILELMASFNQAAEKRDVARLGQILHENFRTVVNTGVADQGMVIDKNGYIGAAKAGKIGGAKRSMYIESINMTGGLTANIKVSFDNEKMALHSQVAAMKENGKWVLLQDLATMKMK